METKGDTMTKNPTHEDDVIETLSPDTWGDTESEDTDEQEQQDDGGSSEDADE